MDPIAEIAAQIHASGRQLVLSITGGGASTIGDLLAVPGGSQTLLEARVPYSHAALAEWLGGTPDHNCAESTARAMAMAAWIRTRQLAADVDPQRLLGVGATASLVSAVPKRGPHRVHVAVQSASSTTSLSLTLDKGARDREQEEQLAARLILLAIGRECGLSGESADDLLREPPFEDEPVTGRHKTAEPAWAELLIQNTGFVACQGNRADTRPPSAIFPGAFHPLHRGHRRMRELAEERLQTPVCYELSMTNVDKPPLDFLEIDERLGQVRAVDPEGCVLLSAAPTFTTKAELWPGCTFVVGADTLQRIGAERYYDNDPHKRDAALDRLAELQCRFLVFGRAMDGKFRSLEDLDLPPQLHKFCTEVPAENFRDDISSTELRSG